MGIEVQTIAIGDGYARVCVRCAVCQHPISVLVPLPVREMQPIVAPALTDHWQAVHLPGRVIVQRRAS